MEQTVYLKRIHEDSEKRNIFQMCACAFLDPSGHTEALIDKICSYAEFFAAYSREVPCGYIAFYANDLETRTAYITMLAVQPVFQGMGIGKLLVEEAFRVAGEKGMESMRLEVVSDNCNAIRFYRRNGFVYEAEAGNHSEFMRRTL